MDWYPYQIWVVRLFSLLESYPSFLNVFMTKIFLWNPIDPRLFSKSLIWFILSYRPNIEDPLLFQPKYWMQNFGNLYCLRKSFWFFMQKILIILFNLWYFAWFPDHFERIWVNRWKRCQGFKRNVQLRNVQHF